MKEFEIAINKILSFKWNPKKKKTTKKKTKKQPKKPEKRPL